MGLVMLRACGRKDFYSYTPHVPSGDAPHPPSVLEVNLDLYKPKPKPKCVGHLLFELETYTKKNLFFVYTKKTLFGLLHIKTLLGLHKKTLFCLPRVGW
jgi:hypothetical protein